MQKFTPDLQHGLALGLGLHLQQLHFQFMDALGSEASFQTLKDTV